MKAALLFTICILLNSGCSAGLVTLPIDNPTASTATRPQEASPIVSPTATATEASPEQLAEQEGISIFDINSFPEQFRNLVKNPESLKKATYTELQQYQRFIEAARAKFFEAQGIADEVAAIKGINPQLRSIWGVIYWVQNNREQAIADGITPVVSPLELHTIRAEPTFQPWHRRIELPLGDRTVVLYGRNLTDVSGDIAFMGRLFADDPNTLITILHMETPPEETFSYKHVLYADIVVFDENFTLPAGTNCQAGRVGEKIHPQPLPVDVHLGFPDDYSGRRSISITRETYNEAIGTNVVISHLVGLSVDGNLGVTSCAHPNVDMDIETQFQSQRYIGSDQFSDWTSDSEWLWNVSRTN